MKWQFGIVGLLGLALGACSGNAGNPNGASYADQPGGAIAVKPETIGVVTYQPYAKAPPFEDMQPGVVPPMPNAMPAPPPAQ